MFTQNVNVPTVNYIYGLGGMDVTTYDIKNVFKDLEDIAKEGKIDKVKRFLKYNKEVD